MKCALKSFTCKERALQKSAGTKVVGSGGQKGTVSFETGTE